MGDKWLNEEVLQNAFGFSHLRMTNTKLNAQLIAKQHVSFITGLQMCMFMYIAPMTTIISSISGR